MIAKDASSTSAWTSNAKLALLIDADNVSAKYMPIILDEALKFGIATYKRIYGDFTDPQMASWRSQLLDNSIIPIQQFSNVKYRKPGETAGKNATDSALIIDAMDILYTDTVDGFIIISSDSDFTRLASRLREGGKAVIGMGKNHTSLSFRQACTRFVNIELLYQMRQASNHGDTNVINTSSTNASELSNVIASIVSENDGQGQMTELTSIADGLTRRYPDFDIRNFGYSSLSTFIQDMDRFKLVAAKNGYDVRLKDTKALRNDVATYVLQLLTSVKPHKMTVSDIGRKVRKRYPAFHTKDIGYASLSQFIRSIDGVTIKKPTNKPAFAKLTKSRKQKMHR